MAVYAISDLHGCLEVYNVLKKRILLPEDKVYCLGDCGDRGPQPWETIKAILTDPQFIYIKGNHDAMLVDAAKEIIDDLYGHDAQRLLSCNGGDRTLDELLLEENPSLWVNQINKLPTYLTYTNTNGQEIFLSHAGCSLWSDEKVIPCNSELLWNRDHYFDNPQLFGDAIVVHGHTPFWYIAEDLEITDFNQFEAFKYANGKKYCIDAGTFATGYSILLNLDTFQSILIDINN